jgi:hypothetical protein
LQGDHEGCRNSTTKLGRMWNFRLLHRLLTQIARLVEINAVSRVTREVVEAARETLVIGVD